jgi:murein DD-endopeptidase MepM/ murein hydrolase activator NlpD
VKLLLLPLLIINLSAISIDTKIEKNQKILTDKEREYKQYKEKIDDIAQDIINLRDEISNLDDKIKSIDMILEKNKMSYELKKKDLKGLQAREEELVNSKKEIEQKLISLIAKDLSISIVLNSKLASNVVDLIKEEIFLAIGNITREEIKELKITLNKTQNELEKKRDVILNIKRYIDDLDDKKSRQISLKENKERYINELSKKNNRYKNKLAEIIAKQNSIKKIVEQLLAQKDNSNIKNEPIEELKFDVRQIGNSYQKVKTIKYIGKKTIAPLDNFTITVQFGTYFDPIYKIKIFNEAVTLKSKERNAKVKSILDGRVVFKGENSILGKVVIIKHSSELHSIYGYLSQFAPHIDIGKRITKGAVIGRIDDELSFEVTKKDYHINPLDIINYR